MLKILNKIKRWVSFKSYLVKELENYDRLLDIRFEHLEDRIKELDQNKVYYLYYPCSPQDVEKLKHLFNRIQKGVEWTLPKIIIVNKEIKEGDKSVSVCNKKSSDEHVNKYK